MYWRHCSMYWHHIRFETTTTKAQVFISSPHSSTLTLWQTLSYPKMNPFARKNHSARSVGDEGSSDDGSPRSPWMADYKQWYCDGTRRWRSPTMMRRRKRRRPTIRLQQRGKRSQWDPSFGSDDLDCIRLISFSSNLCNDCKVYQEIYMYH